MSAPIAAWRATYTPGGWVCLAGPTSLVVLQPAPARVSDLLNRFWEDILSASSIQDISAKLTEHELVKLSGFGLFFWDEAGLHSIVRGDVRVVDANTGQQLTTGEHIVTWTETLLGKDSSVIIEMEPIPAAEVLHLPLLVGAATASTVFLTTRPDALVHSTQPLVTTAAEPIEPVVSVADPVPEVVAPEVEPEAPVASPSAAMAAGGAAAGGSAVLAAVAAAQLGEDGEGSEHVESPSVATSADDADGSDQSDSEQPNHDQIAQEAEQDELAAEQSKQDEHSAEANVLPDFGLAESEKQHEEPSPDPAVVPGPDTFIPDSKESKESEVEDYHIAFGSGLVDKSDDLAAEVSGVADQVEAAEPAVPDFGISEIEKPDFSFDPAPESVRDSLDLSENSREVPGLSIDDDFKIGDPAEFVQEISGRVSEPEIDPMSAVRPDSEVIGTTGPRPNIRPLSPAELHDEVRAESVGQKTAGISPEFKDGFVESLPPVPGQFGAPGPIAGPAAPVVEPAPGTVPDPGPIPDAGPGTDPDVVLPTNKPADIASEPVGPPTGDPNILVPATVCSQGHPNPPGSGTCRQCQGPVGTISRLMPRPALAVVRSSFGAVMDLNTKIMIGRAPETKGDPSVEVLRVPSPNTDISRTHLKVEAKEWQVELTDLHSTNGSVLSLPGRPPFKMQPGESIVVPIGTVVDLGDGVQIRIDPPA